MIPEFGFEGLEWGLTSQDALSFETSCLRPEKPTHCASGLYQVCRANNSVVLSILINKGFHTLLVN